MMKKSPLMIFNYSPVTTTSVPNTKESKVPSIFRRKKKNSSELEQNKDKNSVSPTTVSDILSSESKSTEECVSMSRSLEKQDPFLSTIKILDGNIDEENTEEVFHQIQLSPNSKSESSEVLFQTNKNDDEMQSMSLEESDFPFEMEEDF